MFGRLRMQIAAAALIAASSVFAGPALAQSRNNAAAQLHHVETTGSHTLGGNPNASNQINQVTATTGDLLAVPLVHNTPGNVSPGPEIKNPMAGDPNAAKRGMQYFAKFNCSGCHAANGGGGMGPALS